jgi:two-component system sensor histidine kinase/response regulator
LLHPSASTIRRFTVCTANAMFNLERPGLSQKLTIISVLSTGSALMLVFIAFATTSVLSHTDDERQQLSALAGVIGNNSKTALLYADRKQAEQTLATLAVEDDILQAALYSADGTLLARYAAAALPPGQAAPDQLPAADIAADLHTERSGQLWAPAMRVYRPVRGGDELTGVVMVEVDKHRCGWIS